MQLKAKRTSFCVAFFYPKPRLVRNFSIAFLFDAVQSGLPAHIQSKTVTSRYRSNGFWKRIYNTIEAAFRQGDVNHVTGDVNFLTLLLKKRKTVLTVHDCGYMNQHSPLARFVLRWFWLVLPVYRSRVVTAVSEATKKEVLQHVRCRPDKIRVIPNFISDQYKPNDKPFNAAEPVILHVGTTLNKNLERLIKALAGLPCRLDIIGKLSEEHRTLLERHSLNYTNAYDLREGEVIGHYERCDLLAFVSTHEGFGLPILEAQTVGRPVVTANLSSMPEVAGDGACLVDPYDVASIRKGILRVMEDEAYRQHLIFKGRENAKRFSRESAVAQYVRLYEELTNVP